MRWNRVSWSLSRKRDVVAFVFIPLALVVNRSAHSADESPAVAQQEMLSFDLKLVDDEGNPVAGATVIPANLRSSDGSGGWTKTGDRSGVTPANAKSNALGIATVRYPRIRDIKKNLVTTGVSFHVDHPLYARVDYSRVKLPMVKQPYSLSLVLGGNLEVRPMMDGEPADLDDVYAVWSDGRSWLPEVKPKRTEQGTLLIPAMKPGANTILLSKLGGAVATHYSKIVHFEIKPGDTTKLDVELQIARRIEGSISPNVPRPVRNGRVCLNSFTRNNENLEQIDWSTWVPIRFDGTFSIPGWPVDERMQLVAMCDGFVAKSGDSPEPLKEPLPVPDNFLRPQVYPAFVRNIQVPMVPTVKCKVTAVDEKDQPIEGVQINSYPNVLWWGNGSEVYCGRLGRGEDLLVKRDYQLAVDKDVLPYPFEAVTNKQGAVTLDLPLGVHLRLWNESEEYVIPPVLGKQMTDRIKLVAGQTNRVKLKMKKNVLPSQP